jgi:hypothetical protein
MAAVFWFKDIVLGSPAIQYIISLLQPVTRSNRTITMMLSIFLSAAVGLVGVFAQDNSSTANGCNNGYYPGTDTVIFTTPYTYAQVMSIIGDYQNLTWSGSPAGR